MRTQTKPLIHFIASEIYRLQNALENNRQDIAENCYTNFEKLEHCLPSGSGINNGCKIDFQRSKADKIVINFSYDFMRNGSYDGKFYFTLKAMPSFIYAVDIHISGRDKQGVKDYLYQVFNHDLQQLYECSFDVNTKQVEYRYLTGG